MKYRTLGNSGAIVSTYALGTMTFGVETDEMASHSILDGYLAAGGNLIDTADIYGHGASETIIGNWLASRPGVRDQVVLATKGRLRMGQGRNDVGSARTHLRRALDASLRRLGDDHVDLYQIHSWDPLAPLEETLRFLDDAISSGKILYYGFSNYVGWEITKAGYLARQLGLAAATTLQPQYNLLVREIEAEIVPAGVDRGLGLLPWSPLAAGWLTGKYRRDSTPGAGTRFGENPTRGSEPWELRNSKERTWRIIDAVARVAGERGVPSSHVALDWVEKQPAVTSVILGVRTMRQFEENIGAAGFELSADELEFLSGVSAPEFPGYPYGDTGTALRGRSLA